MKELKRNKSNCKYAGVSAAVIAVLAVVVMAGTARAVTMTAEPDDFSPGSNISNSFDGITLSSEGTGWNNPSGGIFAVDPENDQLEPFPASTGGLVFGTDDSSFPHLFRELGFLAFRADFAAPTNRVSLDFIGNDSADTGLLEAYNASGNLLGRALSPSLGLGEVANVSFQSGNDDISYILAGGQDRLSSLGIDNLQASSHAPEPATLALLGTGLAGLLILRRRRRR